MNPTCSTLGFFQTCWKLLSKLSWIAVCITLVTTILALSPAFKSQTISQEALDIAKWDALKEFIEQCKGLVVYIPLHLQIREK